jgi:hypothetical protein
MQSVACVTLRLQRVRADSLSATEVAHIPYDADKFDEPAERAEALFE